jgi:hypothetical protein
MCGYHKKHFRSIRITENSADSAQRLQFSHQNYVCKNYSQQSEVQLKKIQERLIVIMSNKMQRYTVYFIWKLLYMFRVVKSIWNVMAHGDAREGKWRGNWRIEWVASSLHTTPELGASSITTADVHNSVASSRLNWRPCQFKWTRTFRRKTKSGFCTCVITFQTQFTTTHHQERKQVYLQHLVFVTPLLPPAAIVEELEQVWVCCEWRPPPTAHSNQFQLFHDSGR